MYGYEMLVLAIGALLSAFSPNIWWLIVFRFLLGLGIGGDYPVSATIVSEYAGTKVRGLLISSVFAMQGVGLIVGPLVAINLLRAGIPQDLAWRIMLALGALPALSVFYLRRKSMRHRASRRSPKDQSLEAISRDDLTRIREYARKTGEEPAFG